jgi:ABC-type antimicrobial peptide transport system permease subunit
LNIKTMSELRSASVVPRIFLMVLVAAFSALALLLAGVGVFGLMAYSVAERTPELGIRMALGARPADVARLVMREGLRLTALALATGLLVAMALSRVVSSLLFGVSATDAGTFVAAALVVGIAGLTACWIPARRAVRVSPVVAMRGET